MAAERDAKPHKAGPAALPTDTGPAWTEPEDTVPVNRLADGSVGSAMPDTVAVAIDHDPTGNGLPRVVASGKGFVAEQILTLAYSNGVRVRRDSDLAQILSQIDLDSEIPTEAFAAVAEVLAYVYKANGNTTPWAEVIAP